MQHLEKAFKLEGTFITNDAYNFWIKISLSMQLVLRVRYLQVEVTSSMQVKHKIKTKKTRLDRKIKLTKR